MSHVKRLHSTGPGDTLQVMYGMWVKKFNRLYFLYIYFLLHCIWHLYLCYNSSSSNVRLSVGGRTCEQHLYSRCFQLLRREIQSVATLFYQNVKKTTAACWSACCASWKISILKKPLFQPPQARWSQLNVRELLTNVSYILFSYITWTFDVVIMALIHLKTACFRKQLP